VVNNPAALKVGVWGRALPHSVSKSQALRSTPWNGSDGEGSPCSLVFFEALLKARQYAAICGFFHCNFPRKAHFLNAKIDMADESKGVIG
jgi:hypothetical protein